MLTATKNKSIHYKSILNKGEAFKKTISITHSGVFEKIKSSQLTDFLVRGTVSCIETNTELKFEKIFNSKEGAELYIKKIAEKYPISEILLEKITSQELVLYI